VISFGIHRFMFYRGRRLYGLVIEAISRPGVLADVTRIIADRGLDITYCSTKIVKAEERGMILLFLDFTESDAEPDELVECLRSLEFIERVEVIRPTFEGFIADMVTFPLTINSSRAVIMDENILRGLFLGFRERLGSGGEAMLYHLGLEAGRNRAEYVDRMAVKIGIEGLRERIEIVSGVFRSLGYGIMELLDLREEPPYVNIRLHSSIECELGRGAGRPFSQFLRGAIAGFTSVLFDRDMFALEKRCIAQGDPYCEFEVTPR